MDRGVDEQWQARSHDRHAILGRSITGLLSLYAIVIRTSLSVQESLLHDLPVVLRLILHAPAIVYVGVCKRDGKQMKP